MVVCLTANNIGYQYRCKITDSAGNVVYSEPGTICVAQITWDYTYNIHGVCDVIPYVIWGNSPDDSTTIIDRILMGMG